MEQCTSESGLTINSNDYRIPSLYDIAIATRFSCYSLVQLPGYLVHLLKKKKKKKNTLALSATFGDSDSGCAIKERELLSQEYNPLTHPHASSLKSMLHQLRRVEESTYRNVEVAL